MLAELFPYRCVLCLAPGDGHDLCAGCRADLPWLGNACPRCAKPLPEDDCGLPCGRCLLKPPPQAGTVAAFHYAFPVDQLLLKLKFGEGLVAGRVLGELLTQKLSFIRGSGSASRDCPPQSRFTEALPHSLVDAIIPVPLHPKRLRERGHNQALEIARPVAKMLGIPLRPRWCRRTRATEPQSTLQGPDRRENVRGAFTADARVAGLRVAIVDDVCTTGSTAAAVARALLAAGAKGVVAWCVARA